MSRDKYFDGYNPDFVSAYGKRDWSKDMDMCEKATPGPWEWHQVDEANSHIRQAETKEIIPVSCADGDLMTEAPVALPYWLRQYAHEANEACFWKGQTEITKEALARLQCDYQADKQRFHDRARELSEEKERVKELEQALDKPRSHLWFELNNERAKRASAEDSYRSLRKLHDEQCSEKMEYYNEMNRITGVNQLLNIELVETQAREKKLRELLESIAYAPIFDSEKVELKRRREAADKLLTTLYPEEEKRGPSKTDL